MSDAGQAKGYVEFKAAGTLSTGVKDKWAAPAAGTITSVDAVVGTAPTGHTLDLQIRKNGTVLAPNVGTLAPIATAQNANGSVSASATTIDVVLNDAADISVGAVLTIESEQVKVTGVAGSPQPGPSGLGNVYRLTVTRGANGTTAAAHNGGVAITFAGISIAASATAVSLPLTLGTFAEGDVLDLNIAAVGSTVAGSDLEVTLGYSEN